jgi:hypothetical protein
MLEGTNAIPFQWAMLESDDYQTYIANLRAVGCPEPVLRDLIAAELKELYVVQDRSGSSGLAFWAHGEQRQRETREPVHTQQGGIHLTRGRMS